MVFRALNHLQNFFVVPPPEHGKHCGSGEPLQVEPNLGTPLFYPKRARRKSVLRWPSIPSIASHLTRGIRLGIANGSASLLHCCRTCLGVIGRLLQTVGCVSSRRHRRCLARLTRADSHAPLRRSKKLNARPTSPFFRFSRS